MIVALVQAGTGTGTGTGTAVSGSGSTTAGNINLAAGWDTVWSSIQTAIGTQLTSLLTAIGVLVVVMAVLKWLWERRRGGGGGGNTSGVLWSLVFGATLAAPGLLIPIFLQVLDAIANAVIGVWNGTTGAGTGTS